jgi:S-DNA-T family DNA segregation ATPase FtsK/SpoIIIE
MADGKYSPEPVELDGRRTIYSGRMAAAGNNRIKEPTHVNWPLCREPMQQHPLTQTPVYHEPRGA